jgi:tripartite-type tricarboxylate transporter receptor subunit TctC
MQNTFKKITLVVLLLGASFASFVRPVLAQNALAPYPARAIKFVIPNPAGGLPDTVARLYAQKLSEKFGQAVTVDNHPGANGVLACQTVLSSPKDGYTFLVSDGSTFSINPRLYTNLSYDLKRDFVPVSLAARAPLYLAVNQNVKANNLKELIAYIKANPNKLTYGSSGIGSTHHLSMEAFKNALDLQITHIPYKGSGQSVPALVGGQVDMLFAALPSLSGFIKSGQVKLIANNASHRSDQEPNTPAIAEVIKGYDFSPTIGVFAVKGTPQIAIDRISAEIAVIAKSPEMAQLFMTAGIEPVGSSPANFERELNDEIERIGKAVISAGIKAD